MEKKQDAARREFLKNYICDENWYGRADQYIHANYEKKQTRRLAAKQKKAAKSPTPVSRAMNRISTYFGGSEGMQMFFFFALNIVLALWNFFSIRKGMGLWYLSMGIYYVLLGIVRFLILEPKPFPFHDLHMHPYRIRKISAVMYFLISFVLPFVMLFSLSYFSHSATDSMMVLVFLLYVVFKISAFVSKFVSMHLQDLSPFSALNCATHVELMMALLTLERFWLGNAGDDSFGFVLCLNIISGVLFIVMIAALGIYSNNRAQEHLKKMERPAKSRTCTRITVNTGDQNTIFEGKSPKPSENAQPQSAFSLESMDVMEAPGCSRTKPKAESAEQPSALLITSPSSHVSHSAFAESSAHPMPVRSHQSVEESVHSAQNGQRDPIVQDQDQAFFRPADLQKTSEIFLR